MLNELAGGMLLEVEGVDGAGEIGRGIAVGKSPDKYTGESVCTPSSLDAIESGEEEDEASVKNIAKKIKDWRFRNCKSVVVALYEVDCLKAISECEALSRRSR